MNENNPIDIIDEWRESPYTKVLLRSIEEDHVPVALATKMLAGLREVKKFLDITETTGPWLWMGELIDEAEIALSGVTFQDPYEQSEDERVSRMADPPEFLVTLVRPSFLPPPKDQS